MATQAMLEEAQSALHKLMVGKAVSVFVDQNGERVEYTRAKLADLRSYIEELKVELGLKDAGDGPMRVWF